jgi:raffinose/stachyose/melibiose transport system permease protein
VTRRTEATLNYLFIAIFTLAVLFPITAIVSMSLRPATQALPSLSLPHPLSLDSFTQAWTQGHFAEYLRSSVIVTTAVVTLTSIFSILAGYAFATMQFPGHRALFYVLLLGLVVPEEAIIVPLYFDFRAFNLTNTYWALILPQVGLSVAFGTFWMRAFFRSTPGAVVEAARVEGASTMTILLRVLLPIGAPAILTMVLLVFLWTWNEFLLALVMVSNENLRTAPLGLAFFQGRYTANYSLLSAASVIVALPVVTLYVFLQRHFVRGMLSGSLKT